MRVIARSLLGAFFLIVVPACASSTESPPTSGSDSEVVGGRSRAAGEFRSVGLLVGRDGLCTATLVAPQIVLTAAHCSIIVPESFCIQGGQGGGEGANDCAETDFTGRVPEQWRGPGVCPSGGDMQLVHLKTSITSVTPLAVDDVTVVPNAVCDVIGYGGSDLEHLEATVGRLRIVESAGSGLRGIGVEGHTDVGDSGGPVICDGKLAAITSCGLPGSEEGWYVATQPFHRWLRDTITNWSRPAECARFDMRCEHPADHDEMWTCDDAGHWKLSRSCPVSHCYVNGNQSGCPD